jgi:hypothetical protein
VRNKYEEREMEEREIGGRGRGIYIDRLISTYTYREVHSHKYTLRERERKRCKEKGNRRERTSRKEESASGSV